MVSGLLGRGDILLQLLQDNFFHCTMCVFKYILLDLSFFSYHFPAVQQSKQIHF